MNPWPEHRDDLVISALKNKLNFIASKKANRLCKYFENVARDRSVSSEMSHRHWEGMNGGFFAGNERVTCCLCVKGLDRMNQHPCRDFSAFRALAQMMLFHLRQRRLKTSWKGGEPGRSVNGGVTEIQRNR